MNVICLSSSADTVIDGRRGNSSSREVNSGMTATSSKQQEGTMGNMDLQHTLDDIGSDDDRLAKVTRRRSIPSKHNSSLRERASQEAPLDETTSSWRGVQDGGEGGRVVKAAAGKAEEAYCMQMQYNEKVQKHWELHRRTAFVETTTEVFQPVIRRRRSSPY
jgi:hypothetical protein